MPAFSEDFLIGDNFETVLTISCCCDYGPNASETNERKATN